MSISFLARAACNGRRPSSLNSFHGFERTHLLAQLIKNRSIARIICAPCGYGKTHLALEYAETIFEWNHTFWINGSSPCFIRDLDANKLVAECKKIDPQLALIVFDQLPSLTDQRKRIFAGQVQELLDSHCEVLITCTPFCNPSDVLGEGSETLRSADLLLTTQELDSVRSPDEKLRLPTEEVSSIGRVPGLIWSSAKDSQRKFATGLFSEDMPLNFRLTMACMFVLQQGTFSRLVSLVELSQEEMNKLKQRYPHLGINEENDVFQTCCLDIDDLKEGIRNQLEDFAACSVLGSRQALVEQWANLLLEQGSVDRACKVMMDFNSKRNRLQWLSEHNWQVVRSMGFVSGLQIAQDRQGIKGALKTRMKAFEALCRVVLGDKKNAVKVARSCILEETADPESRVGMAILLIFFGSHEDREAVENVLIKQEPMSNDAESASTKKDQLVSLIRARNSGVSTLCKCWERLVTQECSDEILCLGASWIFQMLGHRESAQQNVREAFPRNVERFIRKKLVSQADALQDYFLASAGLSFEEAHKRGVSSEGRALEPAVLYGLRQIEMRILVQRNRFTQLEHTLQEKRDVWIRTHPVVYADALAETTLTAKRRVPLLTLRFFGGFEVLIGDIPLDSSNFKRQNCRLLLVLLALNQGKEIARDRVATAMWPDSDPKGAQKNFYTVWAQLRKVLTLEDGTCPYLIRQQHGCSLDMRYVQSDLVRHGEICRELLFGKPDVVPWANLFTEIDRDFSGDLLPSEHANQTILAARAEYRSRLIDALVAAAGTITETDHPEWGIWFARTALRHDETREDAWLALMKGQIACSQRTAAMMTYLKCRAILDERLGIDPSFEAESLYADLLNGEVPLFVK